MGRLLVRLRPGDKIHSAEALAMFANSLQCALPDYATAADEECRLRPANAAWWGAPDDSGPQRMPSAALCRGSNVQRAGGVGWTRQARAVTDFAVPGSRGMSCGSGGGVGVFPPWQALVMRHMEAVRALLESGESGEDDAWLLFRCTHTLATACRRAGDRRTAARHFMRCQVMGLQQLMAAYELVDASEVEAAVRRVQQLLSLLTAPPADESSPWPRPKLHAAFLAHAGNLLHDCGHKDAALVTLSQAWDVLTASGCSLDFITDNHAQQPRYILSSEDDLLDTGIKMGLAVRLVEKYLRSGEEAAAALELDAAVNWYHKAADVARVCPSKQQVAFHMSHLSYRIGELQYKAWSRCRGCPTVCGKCCRRPVT